MARPSRLAIVDDDAFLLRALSRMLSLCGYDVEPYSSADEFLRSLKTGEPEALLVDLRMPGTDGMALLDLLRERGYRIPTVFLSGHADIPTSVRAIRAGAVDFLEKPCDEATLLTSLARAFDMVRRDRDTHADDRDSRARWLTLTPRERQVCRLVVHGHLNKQIAASLGTREKTIKVHRARAMAKMGAPSLAELVRIVDRLGEGGRTPDVGPPSPRRAIPPDDSRARAPS
jgi:FixJ family two-component response regulator